jgi:hypothetical protein
VKLNPGFSCKNEFNEKTLFTRKLELHLRKKLGQCHLCSIALYGADIRAFQKLDQKYLQSLDIWSCRRMEKISWNDRL